MDILIDAITQCPTPPPSSNGSCRPIDQYPTALSGPCSYVDKAVIPAANGTTRLVTLVASLLAHPLNGDHVARSVCGKYKYKSIRLTSLLPMRPPVLLLPDGSPRAWWLWTTARTVYYIASLAVVNTITSTSCVCVLCDVQVSRGHIIIATHVLVHVCLCMHKSVVSIYVDVRMCLCVHECVTV